MPTQLKNLQSLLYRLITAPSGVAEGLAAEQDLGAGGLDAIVLGDDRLSSEARVDIYANMYFYRILDALKEDFPATVAVLGDDNFHNLVTGYLLEYPPTGPSITHSGSHLAEYLHDQTRAKVLFATHFHELTDLARERPRVRNLSMAVREWGDEVIFLRRVIEQPASRSYGIEVARLAGLPDSIITRAREILANLEQGELDEAGMPRIARDRRAKSPAPQLGLFSPREERIVDELRSLDIERITPMDALNALARLAARLKQEK